ncbi:MAG: hypothetical protein WC595_02715 [Candidatus Nanoarchaeia archaeon]
MEYNAYQPSQNQSYNTQSTSYGDASNYRPDIVISSPRKGRCPTGGKCVVCSRLCMME